jgi:hypothetical protein
MARPGSGSRKQAEARFDKAQRTTEIAQSLIDSELAATRAKTKKLRAARLAQEAKDAENAPEAKPPAKKAAKKTAKKPAKKAEAAKK